MDILSALRKVTTSIKTWADSKLENKLDKNLGTDNVGKVLAVGNNGDIEPQLLDTGFVVLSGTDDNPINIDEIKTSGTYLIKGTVTTSMDTTSGSESAKLNKIFMDGFACGELMSVYSLQDGFINQFIMNPTRPLVRLDSGSGYSDAIDVSYIQPVEKTAEMTQPVGMRRDGQLFTKPFNQIQSDWNQNDNAARDYIKNRTHYKRDIHEYICFNGELSFNETRTIPMEIEIPVGTTIKTYFGSEVFTSTVVLDNDGDLNASNGLFNIFFRNGSLDIGNYYMGGNVKIVAENFALVTPLDERYIPNSIARMPKSTTITLTATIWRGTTSPYWQRISMQGLTPNSMITIHPTPEQLAELQDTEITLMIANDNGVITAYAMNNKPTKDLTMQVLITEIQTI